MSPVVTIQGKKLKLTNLEKVLYPAAGFTKAQVIDYYRQVADVILPHLKNRPVTLKRFPDGVQEEFFYEKQCPAHRPDWMTTLGQSTMNKNYCLLNNLPALIWTANLAALEIHPLLCRTDNLDRPTMVVFDLDPGPPAALADCLQIAHIMREMLEGVGLQAFAKTSGGKGLHLCIPLNTEVTFDRTRHFAATVARTLEKAYPDRIVSKMNKSLRRGKVFIDWSQNSQHKTTVAVYSLRAQPAPTVSMPVSWEQIDRAIADNDARPLIFSPEQALARLHQVGDLFEPLLSLQQRLPSTPQAKTPARQPDSPNAADPHLDTYRRKRDFTKTGEPSAGTAATEEKLFVIQKHAARRLHYDLRLEAEGVLKSWAVPKGPSSDPADKRLAVQTEDHPFDYKDFEGRIPAGHYGSGHVIVWDRGRYENVSHNAKKQPVSLVEAIKNGSIEIVFHGQKMKGRYALVRMHAEGEQNNWLLIKKKDKYVHALPADLEQANRSVISDQPLPPQKKTSKKSR